MIKWIRKNERKIITTFAIVIMIAFVGGVGLRQCSERRGGGNKVYADYGDGKEIRFRDIAFAQRELKVLERLFVDRYLLGGASMSNRLLGLQLFPNSQIAGQFRQQFIQLAENGQIQADMDLIDEFFTHPQQYPEVLWQLLKAEAHEAGCTVSNAVAAEFLQQLIAGVSQGQITAAKVVSEFSLEIGLTEQQILRIIADLLAVEKYGNYVMAPHTVTMNEVKNEVARQTEKLSGEYFEIDAELLIDDVKDPSDQQIQQHFDTYKKFTAGTYSPDNPFGFGYQLAKRVRLEYFFLDMNEVKKQIAPPTSQELEKYYSRNLSNYTQPELIDPNNPDAGTTDKTRPFTEVVGQIRQEIIRERQENKATMILNEARQIIEEKVAALEADQITTEALQQAVGDYPATAEKLQQLHNIKIYTGKTGWLQPQDMTQDTCLSRLMMTSSQGRRIRLHEIAYNVTPEGDPIFRPGVPSTRSWENISPLDGSVYVEDLQLFVPLKAMVRVIGVRAAQEPTGPDMSYENAGISIPGLIEAEPPIDLHEQIINDFKVTEAMEIAQERGEKMVEKIGADGWDKALAFYKKTYPASIDPNDPAADVSTRTINNQRVLSQTQILIMQKQLARQSAMAGRYQQQLQNFLFGRKLYDLIKPQQQTTGQISELMAFEPSRSVVIVKELTKEPASEKDYADSKNMVAVQTAFGSTMDLGLLHYHPKHILERMQYNMRPQEEQSEPSEPAQEEEDEEA